MCVCRLSPIYSEMDLLLKWTTGGALWVIGSGVSYRFVFPQRFRRLRRVIDEWYHRLPSESEFLEEFDRQGFLLAELIRRQTGHNVEYSPLCRVDHNLAG